MWFSRGAQSALRAVGCLAHAPQGEAVTAETLSACAHVPRPYLAKLLQELTRAQLLTSTKGPRGGFVLARPAAEITIASVIEAIDGPLPLWECVLDHPECHAGSRCAFCRRWRSVGKPVETFLQNRSVETLLE